MADKEWPVHMKRLEADGTVNTEYAHNKKELAAWEERGFSESSTFKSGGEYPVMLYNTRGETRTAATKEQEDALSASGFGRKPYAAAPVETPLRPASGYADGRVDVLEYRVSQIEESVREMREDLKAIMDAVTAQPAGRGRGKGD